jgi:signal peptidase I
MKEREKWEKPENSEDKNENYGVGGFLLEIVKVFFLALVIITPIRVFLFQPFFVQGASMEPNFKNGEYLIVNELGYKKTDVGISGKDFFTVDPYKELSRQEIVVFRYPKDTQQFFIKRIIGLPGEKIRIDNDKITIFNDKNPDGFVLDESEYLSPKLKNNTSQTIELSNDEYFVMGDNRPQSFDSRGFGPVKKGLVIGKVLIRAWPVGRAGIF